MHGCVTRLCTQGDNNIDILAYTSPHQHNPIKNKYDADRKLRTLNILFINIGIKKELHALSRQISDSGPTVNQRCAFILLY